LGGLAIVLDRVQSDFDFYVAVLSNPDVALAPYSLTADEAETIRNPAALWRYLTAAEIQLSTGLLGQTVGADEGPPSEGPPSEGPPPPSEGPIGVILLPEGPPPEGPPIEGPLKEGLPIGGIGVRGPGGGGVGVTPNVGGEGPAPGVIGVIHFLPGPEVIGIMESVISEEIMANPAVVSAVENIRGAADSAARLVAVNQLMREIG
jgi:hypothetical protein